MYVPETDLPHWEADVAPDVVVVVYPVPQEVQDVELTVVEYVPLLQAVQEESDTTYPALQTTKQSDGGEN